jgi:natural product biosynthesis luciferase-like monooxygenase protein
MRTILVGEETLLAACAELLRGNGHDIVAVVAGPGPAADWAQRSGLALFGKARALLSADLGAVDYLFSITNLSVLPPEVLALPRRAAINFHDGPLPTYAGLNTPVWALLAGESAHGISWHLMTDALDGGDILAREAIAIDDGESAVSLNAKCFEAALRSFGALVGNLDAALAQAVPQPSPPERLFGRRDRPEAAATIDWSASAQEIARFVSALDFGNYRNPMGVPKALLGDSLILIHEISVLDSWSGARPGTILQAGAQPVVATGSTDVRLGRISDADGRPMDLPASAVGGRFAALDDEQRKMLNAIDSAAGLYEGWWRRRLLARDSLQLPAFRAPSPLVEAARVVQDRVLPSGRVGSEILTALVAYLGRVADRDMVDIGYFDPIFSACLDGMAPWFASQMPLQLRVDWALPLDALEDGLEQEIAAMHKRVAIARDLIGRSPELRGSAQLAHPVAIQMVAALDDSVCDDDSILTLAIRADGGACRWTFDSSRLDPAAADDLWLGFMAFLASAQADPSSPVGSLPVLSPAEHAMVIGDWNATQAPRPEVQAIHRLFVEQAARTPGKIAVTSRGVSLTYAELDARSNQMARHLSALGVGPDVLVGINLERSVDLAVSVLAVHKAGGAYVPLDPAYPRDRLAHMVSDSALKVVLTQGSLIGDLPVDQAEILNIDEARSLLADLPVTPFDGGARPENLAYVIYTSGSTGLPKGVMVEHRNVLNFFAGMDRKLEPDGVWLAVTSLSFDISVLELCWPLTRGYHVVIATEREVRGDVVASVRAKPIDFSLFYFASGDSGSNADQYRLLLDGARFADANGFAAIWTPERHFHAFGAPYPNPSVTSAAIAAVTSRIKIRAGSVVAPLHHPVRIAEEWALVDNLSNGRVGIAFASGWQPDDFLLNPQNFADRRGVLMRSIEDVRALWRGEKRSFPGPLGHDVEVAIYPRPVQPELPFWITSAGNADTFAAAGRIGACVLTHLLGQTVEEVGEKVAAYRAAWREAGHAGDGHVTLMLHSFVGADADRVREIVRQPLIDYLRTSTDLVKQYAWSFPAFKRRPGAESAQDLNISDLSTEETDALLEYSFERYFESSGLFGTAEHCADLVERVAGVGIDEIGCLIDFGIAVDTVLEHLPALNDLRMQVQARFDGTENTLPELMARHGVTHLQCTPSLAQMLTMDDLARPRLASLRRMMVGGEAFPPPLARDLAGLVGGAVMNMYGPTETTIWSAVHELETNPETPPLGKPLVNQQIYILDRRLQPVRPGMPGELVIGGDGVVRGYLGRPELTAERFIADPLATDGRAYRTGDIARQRADGTLEFMGRLDHQVKIRGYRIELGEIEAALAAYPQVREAIVIAQGEGAGTRLIAYLTCEWMLAPTPDMLREHLRAGLPDFMIPSAFVMLPALPRTPNGKIDRKALPAPDTIVVEQVEEEGGGEPASALQEQILDVWRDLLKVPRVGLRDNFFDLGGNSLLAVQMHRRLSTMIERPLALTDIFRFPTIASLSSQLSDPGAQPAAAREGLDRARSRRAALQRRGVTRPLVRN